MLNLDTIRPGKTINIPFATYDSNDPSASVTCTGLAATDIEIYKDGSLTQRASDSGYAVDTDLDGIVGIHTIQIDLADNDTAGFFSAGSEYIVVVSSITVDAGVVSFVAARFTIGYPEAILNTTIATLASQTSFTLTKGPAEANALVGRMCVIHDVASEVQVGHAVISAYDVTTKTVTLAAGTTFTAAATDNISILGLAPLQPAVSGRTLGVESDGDLTKVNLCANTTLVDTTTTNTDLVSQADITGGAYPLDTDANGRIRVVDGTGAGELDTITGKVNALIASGDADGLVDDIWDEPLTGGTHNVATSSGKRLRQIDAAFEITSGTAVAGSTSTTINLNSADGADVTTDNIYASDRCIIVAGTGVGEHNLIKTYASGTQIATMNKAWVITPDDTSEYILVPADVDVEMWNDNTVTGDGDWAAMQADLDIITDSDGVILGAAGVDLILDEVNTGATHNVTNSLGKQVRQAATTGLYEGGQIWIDTVGGAAGTDVDENGTVDNPSDNIADATTLAVAKGFKRFRITPGSSITLAQDYLAYVFEGDNGVGVALGGRSVTDCVFRRCSATGIATGTGRILFDFARIGSDALSCTLPPCHIHNSDVLNDIEANAAGSYFIDNSRSNIAGSTTWSFDFGGAIGNVDLSVNGYNGGIKLENMGDLGTDVATISGSGGQVIEGTCTGGNVTVRGNFSRSFTVTDNITWDEPARVDIPGINATVDTAISDAGLATAASIAALNDLSQTEVTGGAFSLDTDANGRTRHVVGTGVGELSTTSGLIDGITGTISTLDALDTAQDTQHATTQALVAASAIRAAIGLASANLDTQLAALPTANENADALLDRTNGIESSVTPRQALRAIAAKSAGLISAAGTGTEAVKGIGQGSGGTTRLTATVDALGNISAWALNL